MGAARRGRREPTAVTTPMVGQATAHRAATRATHPGKRAVHAMVHWSGSRLAIADSALTKPGRFVGQPDLVQDGEQVVIERHGRPVAQLVPVRRRRASAA